MDIVFELGERLDLEDLTEDYIASIDIFDPTVLGKTLIASGVVVGRHSFSTLSTGERILVQGMGTPPRKPEEMRELVDAVLTAHHEYDHFRVLASTPVGMFWMRLHWARIGQAVIWLRKLSGCNKVYMPVARWEEVCEQAMPGSFLSQLTTHWRIISALEETCLGLAELNIVGGVKLWNAMNQFMSIMPTTRPYRSDFVDPMQLPIPKSSESNEPLHTHYRINAVHLVEAQARLYEFELAAFILQTCNLPSHELLRIVNSRLFDIYRHAFDVADEIMEIPWIEMMEQLRFAIDLALLSPMEPRLSGLWKDREFRWQDVHPGWRFVRILQRLKERQLHKKPQRMSYEEFSDVVCGDLHWPRPNEVMAALSGKRYEGDASVVQYMDRQQQLCIAARLAMPGVFCNYREYENGARAIQEIKPAFAMLNREIVLYGIGSEQMPEFISALAGHTLTHELVCHQDYNVTEEILAALTNSHRIEKDAAQGGIREVFEQMLRSFWSLSSSQLQALPPDLAAKPVTKKEKISKLLWLSTDIA